MSAPVVLPSLLPAHFTLLTSYFYHVISNSLFFKSFIHTPGSAVVAEGAAEAGLRADTQQKLL